MWSGSLPYNTPPPRSPTGFQTEGPVVEVGDFLVPLPKHKRTTVEEVGDASPFLLSWLSGLLLHCLSLSIYSPGSL